MKFFSTSASKQKSGFGLISDIIHTNSLTFIIKYPYTFFFYDKNSRLILQSLLFVVLQISRIFDEFQWSFAFVKECHYLFTFFLDKEKSSNSSLKAIESPWKPRRYAGTNLFQPTNINEEVLLLLFIRYISMYVFILFINTFISLF